MTNTAPPAPQPNPIIRGEQVATTTGGGKDAEDHTQQVILPEPGRRVPGLSEGERPQPA